MAVDLAGASGRAGVGVEVTPNRALAIRIAADMEGRHEAAPHGVPPSFDWAKGPVTIMGNNPGGWRAITSWGAVYETAAGNPAVNTRVNIRRMKTFFLQKRSGKWLLLQETNSPMGAAYREDFSGGLNKPADLRLEPDGSVSATAGAGSNFHFYPRTRASIDPDDLAGIVVVLEARLIVGDPGKPDDRAMARYLCGTGADYYPAIAGGWPGNESFNPGVAIGKLKLVKPEWRSFAMTTLSEKQLEQNAPPISLAGILQ